MDPAHIHLWVIFTVVVDSWRRSGHGKAAAPGSVPAGTDVDHTKEKLQKMMMMKAEPGGISER